MNEITTEQVNKKIPNPLGTGGFGDHPEHRSNGTWDKNNSFGYWLGYFKSLSINEFKEYKSKHPEMTMAALATYARVAKMINELKEFQEVANRTEGMPRQSIDLDGELIYKMRLSNEDFIRIDATITGSVLQGEDEEGQESVCSNSVPLSVIKENTTIPQETIPDIGSVSFSSSSTEETR